MLGRSKALMLAAMTHAVVIASPSAALAQSQGPTSPALPPLPPAARTQAPGDDVIYMNNGGIIRGTIIDAVPDAQARIQLVTGEIATIPWQQIRQIEHAGAPPSRPSEKAPPPPPEVWVHFDAPPGVLVQQDRTSSDDWVTVCTVPCDRPLPTAYYYRVTGSGIRTSADFVLHASPGTREAVVVDSASQSAFVLGVVGMIGGGIVAYVGLIVADVGLLQNAFDENGNAGTAATGLALMGVGLVSAVVGLVVTLTNARTKVSEDVNVRDSGLLLPGSGNAAPAWRTDANEQKSLPPLAGVPFFSGRF